VEYKEFRRKVLEVLDRKFIYWAAPLEAPQGENA
jgi:hypothetical protein